MKTWPSCSTGHAIDTKEDERWFAGSLYYVHMALMCMSGHALSVFAFLSDSHRSLLIFHSDGRPLYLSSSVAKLCQLERLLCS